MERILSGIAAVLLGGQLAWIGMAHAEGAIYGNWAMYHTGVNYEASATVDGVTLSPDAFFARYHIPPTGFNGRSLDHVKAILKGRESDVGAAETVQLDVHWAENGGQPSEWLWRNDVVRVAAAKP